jgi:putative transposase
MPSKNTIREFRENGYYHVYNRGVEKREIFLDNDDYRVFLHFLKVYLSPKVIKKDFTGREKFQETQRKNFANDIDLLAFCLMPNHYHLLIKQTNERSMSDFMRCLTTAYVMYFNKKYKRAGTLFQGRYKAVSVKNDDYLLHLSRYIHLNPTKTVKGLTLDDGLERYDFSSYPDYLGLKNRQWIDKKTIQDYFKNPNMIDRNSYTNYRQFVEDVEFNEGQYLDGLVLEET